MPLGQRSLSCGILAAGMQLGAIVASGLTGLLLEPLGWRWVFIGFALPSLLWTVGFYLRFRNHPQQDERVNSAELALIIPTPAFNIWRQPRDQRQANQSAHRTAELLFSFAGDVVVVRATDLP